MFNFEGMKYRQEQILVSSTGMKTVTLCLWPLLLFQMFIKAWEILSGVVRVVWMLQRESGEHISVSPGRGEHPRSAARPQLRSTCRGSHEWQLGCHLACAYAAYTRRGACTGTPPAPDWHTALPYCYTRVLATTRSRLSKPPCPGLQSLLHRGQLFQPDFNLSVLEN